jgi:hypothetical protein
LASGGAPKGVGELKCFSFSVNDDKYPNGAVAHFQTLKEGERYAFIKELAIDFYNFWNAPSEPFVEWPEDWPKQGESCGPNCECVRGS